MPSLIHRASFYVVHHSGILDPFLDADEHSLEDCDLTRTLPRSETMAETAPLIIRNPYEPKDRPIFLCICHSQWPFLQQKALFFVRGCLAVYLTTALVLGFVNCFEVFDSEASPARFFAFDSGNISLMVQAIYYWITAVCLSADDLH